MVMISEFDPPIKRAKGYCSHVMRRRRGYRDCCKTLFACNKATCGGCAEMEDFIIEAKKIIKKYYDGSVETTGKANP